MSFMAIVGLAVVLRMIFGRRRRAPSWPPGEIVIHGYIIERSGGGEPMPVAEPAYTGNVVKFDKSQVRRKAA